MSEEAGDIVVSRDQHVLTITLNRPTKLNTVTPDMGRTLTDLGAAINADDEVRAVLLTGSGTRSFSAGSDVSVLDEYGTNWQLRNRADYVRALWGVRKPLIAAIRGHCIGGGLEMALASDIRIATPDARFGAGEIKLGWHGGAGNTQLLPRVIGPGRAQRMLFTGELITAAQADHWGLIDEVVDDADLDRYTNDLAANIADNAPIAAQLTKHLVRMAMSTAVDVGLAYENDLFAYCFTTADSQEGRRAFLEKRPPHFSGT